MITDQAKKLTNIKNNQNQDTSLMAQLLLHLSDRTDNMSSNIQNTNTKVDSLSHNIDDKISSTTTKTEVKLIKWIIGTDIALAAVIIAAIGIIK